MAFESPHGQLCDACVDRHARAQIRRAQELRKV
jgi:hypothetical protein